MHFSSYHSGTQHKRVIFLLPGWGIPHFLMLPFSFLLILAGFYCVTYEYDASILSSNIQETRKHFQLVAADIRRQIIHLKKQGHMDFSLFGSSLGTILIFLVANQSRDVGKIICNLSGADLAETVWSWDSVVKGFKETLFKQSLTLSQLQKSWQLISPINNLEHLQHKQVLFYLNSRDEIIPFSQQEKLLSALQKRSYTVTVRTNNFLPHLPAAIKNLCNFPVYLRFLKTSE